MYSGLTAAIGPLSQQNSNAVSGKSPTKFKAAIHAGNLKRTPPTETTQHVVNIPAAQNTMHDLRNLTRSNKPVQILTDPNNGPPLPKST